MKMIKSAPTVCSSVRLSVRLPVRPCLHYIQIRSFFLFSLRVRNSKFLGFRHPELLVSRTPKQRASSFRIPADEEINQVTFLFNSIAMLAFYFLLFIMLFTWARRRIISMNLVFALYHQ